MSDQNERGYWFDPMTGEVTPVGDAPYGWVLEPAPSLDPLAGDRLRFEPMEIEAIPGRIRPATKEEAEGDA